MKLLEIQNIVTELGWTSMETNVLDNSLLSELMYSTKIDIIEAIGAKISTLHITELINHLKSNVNIINKYIII